MVSEYFGDLGRQHMAKDWWKSREREPSGRPKRHWMPDRGTEELQARRQAIMGDHRQPVDIHDPIDRLHRGQIKHLTDDQALAAHIWRQAKRDSTGGQGPRLAVLSDQVRGPIAEDNPTREQAARMTLHTIEWTLSQQPLGVSEQTKATVERNETPRRLGDLKKGLQALAEALKLC